MVLAAWSPSGLHHKVPRVCTVTRWILSQDEYFHKTKTVTAITFGCVPIHVHAVYNLHGVGGKRSLESVKCKLRLSSPHLIHHITTDMMYITETLLLCYKTTAKQANKQTSRCPSWYDLKCCQDIKLQQIGITRMSAAGLNWNSFHIAAPSLVL